MKKMFLLLVPLFLIAHPFDYDLQVETIPGKNSQVVLCFHGMGQNSQVVHSIYQHIPTNATWIGFNFPDYDMKKRMRRPAKTTFGTREEILPALYMLKKCVLENGFEVVSLYGFSAGGGAVINTLAALEQELSAEEREKVLAALRKGVIVLDTPLKSIAEIIDFRGASDDLMVIGKRYFQNEMEPIDAVLRLKGLGLHFVVCFQEEDEVLSNRDDALFIERLKECSSVDVIKGAGKGHAFPHEAFLEFLNDAGFPL